MVHGKQQSRRKKHVKKEPVQPDSVSKLSADGKEILDSTPLVIPAGFGPQARSQRDELMHMLRETQLRQFEDEYIETPEEADDFDEPDIDGHDVLFSNYEMQELQEEIPIDAEYPPEDEPEGAALADRPEDQEVAPNPPSEKDALLDPPPAPGAPAS